MPPLSSAQVRRSLLVYGVVRAVVLPFQVFSGIVLIGAFLGDRDILIGSLLIIDAVAGAALTLFAVRQVDRRGGMTPFRLLITLGVIDGVLLAAVWIAAPMLPGGLASGFGAAVVIDLLAASTMRAAEREAA